MAEAYATLAEVYEWLTPAPLLTPEGNVAALAPVVDALPAGALGLDCAFRIGLLAVGLALRGFDVAASDAGAAMVARTRTLAQRRGVALPAAVRRWEDLGGEGPYDAVFCVGNSLAHAADRRAALAGMARVLAPGGLVVLTSRNWQRERAGGSRLEVDDRLTERDGGRALVVREWTIPPAWGEAHGLDVAVAVLGDGGAVRVARERLAFWPFTVEALAGDLLAAGLEVECSTYTPAVERYLVTARRRDAV